ncbi:MAG: Fe-S cluster assembly protein SufD [Gemmatimonadota bacterium]|nr:Fe-S cluster assembly protein SufD [Gemmatimonadota bacterium]MDH5760971.1 Fe-S cluster assembly protein SufD [Gemmatimonadota bacterium]
MTQKLTEGVTAAFNADAVERIAQGEPEWLRERRLQAWEVYESLPIPTTRLEEWRYTDLSRKLELDALVLSSAAAATDDESTWPAGLRTAMEEDSEASGHIVLIDGHVVHTDIDAELAGKGVILASLHDAVANHSDLLEKHLATEAVPAEEGKFAALNAALWNDGIFLYVPRGVRLEHPVRVTRWFSESGTAYFSRTLIVAETASQVSYVDEVLSDDFSAQTFTSSAVEVLAADGAQVQYVAVQRLGRGGFYQAVQRTLAQRDSTLDTLNVALGGSVTRVDLNARLLGPGSNSDMLGLYFGDGDQHFDFNTSQDHVSHNAGSDLLYKGALDGASRAVFRGIIRVHPGAQRTDAYQTNRNLLLSPHARADSLPNLEIEADDVKCSHGASVGELDAEARFYLMSRGLNHVQAERLVVLGFLGEVLSRLPLGGVGQKVTRVIEEKLRNHG